MAKGRSRRGARQRRDAEAQRRPHANPTASPSQAGQRSLRVTQRQQLRDVLEMSRVAEAGPAQPSGGPSAFDAQLPRNASLKLLRLDFFCYHLITRVMWLNMVIGDVADEGASWETAEGSDHRDDDFEQRFRRKHVKVTAPRRSRRGSFQGQAYADPLTAVHAPSELGSRRCRLPWLRHGHAHFFLEPYLKTAINFLHIRRPYYFTLWARVESELLQIFGITLPEAATEAATQAVEMQSMQDFSKFIRAVEGMLHTLSKKPTFYLHVTLVALIALLRNLRRLILRHPPCIVLVEFTVLCTQALWLTQAYVHQYSATVYRTVASRRGIRVDAQSVADGPSAAGTPSLAATEETVGAEGESERLTYRDLRFFHNVRLLESMNEACKEYKCAIITLGQQSWGEYLSESEFEAGSPVNGIEFCSSQWGVETLDSGGEAPVWGEGRESSSVEGTANGMCDGGDRAQSRLPTSQMVEFSAKAARLLNQWALALCKYATEANKLTCAPVFAEYKVVGDGEVGGGPSKLYKKVRGPNLALHRNPVLVALMGEPVPATLERVRSRFGGRLASSKVPHRTRQVKPPSHLRDNYVLSDKRETHPASTGAVPHQDDPGRRGKLHNGIDDAVRGGAGIELYSSHRIASDGDVVVPLSETCPTAAPSSSSLLDMSSLESLLGTPIPAMHFVSSLFGRSHGRRSGKVSARRSVIAQCADAADDGAGSSIGDSKSAKKMRTGEVEELRSQVDDVDALSVLSDDIPIVAPPPSPDDPEGLRVTLIDEAGEEVIETAGGIDVSADEGVGCPVTPVEEEVVSQPDAPTEEEVAASVDSRAAEASEKSDVVEAGTDVEDRDAAAGADETAKEPDTTPSDMAATGPTTVRRKRKWSREEVVILVNAINRHGVGKWTYFSRAYFDGRWTGPQLKDKWCNLMRYKYVYQDKTHSNAVPNASWRLVDSF
ncbi:Myb family DNA-binding domain-containing protein [Babesia caballi]|uniref:Myb family DNA-binding domain-containing protein n=1 Tax=Babesia caballi TaxID=5871 RepID=A0AAV4LLZ6_BABCB|nr:Myb family DNA-binding domain-containing protein [Babesia caballi]